MAPNSGPISFSVHRLVVSMVIHTTQPLSYHSLLYQLGLLALLLVLRSLYFFYLFYVIYVGLIHVLNNCGLSIMHT